MYGLRRSREQPQALQPSRLYNRDAGDRAQHLTVLERENPLFLRAPTISSLFTVPDARACNQENCISQVVCEPSRDVSLAWLLIALSRDLGFQQFIRF